MRQVWSGLAGLLGGAVVVRLAAALLAPLIPALAVLLFVASLLVWMLFPNRRP